MLPVWFSKLDGHSQSISLLTVHHDQGHTCPSCQKAAFARRTPDSPPSLNPHGKPRPPPALRSWAPCAPPSAASSISSARRCPSRWPEKSPAPPGSGRTAESPRGLGTRARLPGRSVPHRGHRGDRVEPSRGFPRLGGSRRAPHRPPPPRVRPGALPAAAPRPLAVPAARPYLHGAPERVESTVQQQGGPATAEQPQKLPEQHPSWAGGRGSGLRATWGRSRASRRQRRWLAPIPGAPPSQL